MLYQSKMEKSWKNDNPKVFQDLSPQSLLSFSALLDSIGLSFILGKAKKINSNIKIVASGQGGDEIYSNNQTYTFDTPNPKKFTNDLDKIFPWQNFFYGTQISYLGKEESIGGSYGLETRYPFLDRDLVQEYLNLPGPDFQLSPQKCVFG